LGLQIAMHDPVAVRFRERQTDLVEKIRDQRQSRPQGVLLKVRERLTIQELHHQVGQCAAGSPGDSEIRDVDNVGMAQPPASLSFSLKTREKMGVRGPFRGDYFYGNDARRSQVRRQIDVAHSTRTELLIDSVFAVKDLAEHGSAQAPS